MKDRSFLRHCIFANFFSLSFLILYIHDKECIWIYSCTYFAGIVILGLIEYCTLCIVDRAVARTPIGRGGGGVVYSYIRVMPD